MTTFVGSHLYEMFRIGKSVQTESRLVLPEADMWGRVGWQNGISAMGARFLWE